MLSFLHMLNRMSFIFKNGYTLLSNCQYDPFSCQRYDTDFNFLIELNNCVFSMNCVYSGSGGILYISNTQKNLRISNSVFFSCHVSSNFDGGAIYLVANSSNLQNICAYYCSSRYFLFGFLDCLYENYLGFLSITKCNEVFSGVHPIAMVRGFQVIKSLNSSYNKVLQSSGFGNNIPSNFLMEYCQLSNNQAQTSICLHLHGNKGTISFINIIHNNSPNSYGVSLFDGSAQYALDNVVASNNTDILLYSTSGQVLVSESFIFHTNQIISGPIQIQTNCIFEFTNAIHINFYSTHLCESENRLPLFTGYHKMKIILGMFIVFGIISSELY